MNVYHLSQLSPEDLKTVLDTEAVAIEEGKYQKPLTPDELDFYKDQLAEASIAQGIVLEEFSAIKEEFKERLNPFKEKISEALQAIKFKCIDKEGKVYRLADFDNQLMHKVDASGNVISSRKMLPEERQFRLQALKSVQQ